MNSDYSKRHAPTSKVKKIIDECAKADVFEINLSGGEPTLHPDFLDIVKYCKDNNFIVGFTSNGQFDEKISKKVSRYIDGCAISIHGFRDTHNRIVNKKDSFDQALKNLEILSDEGVITQVDFTLIKDNFADLYPFGKYILEGPAHSYAVLRLIPVGRGKDIPSLTIEEYNKAFSQLYQLKREFPEKVVELADAFPYCLIKDKKYRELVRGCSAGIFYAAIDIEGNIKPCPADELIAGNIFEDSLEEIWQNSEELEKYRELKHLPRSCKNCDYLGDCLLGCRASSEEGMDHLLFLQEPSPLRKVLKERKRKKRKISGKPKLWEHLKIRKDLDGYIIYHPLAPVLYVNEVGGEIIKYCNGHNTLDSISHEIAKKYKINENKIKSDIEKFLLELGDFIKYEA